MGSAAALTIPTSMSAVPCGINGFGRIGRLVARIMVLKGGGNS
jgi:lactate dehydrogenase-like 2-hydroxyacid dehydrogenase